MTPQPLDDPDEGYEYVSVADLLIKLWAVEDGVVAPENPKPAKRSAEVAPSAHVTPQS